MWADEGGAIGAGETAILDGGDSGPIGRRGATNQSGCEGIGCDGAGHTSAGLPFVLVDEGRDDLENLVLL